MDGISGIGSGNHINHISIFHHFSCSKKSSFPVLKLTFSKIRFYSGEKKPGSGAFRFLPVKRKPTFPGKKFFPQPTRFSFPYSKSVFAKTRFFIVRKNRPTPVSGLVLPKKKASAGKQSFLSPEKSFFTPKSSLLFRFLPLVFPSAGFLFDLSIQDLA